MKPNIRRLAILVSVSVIAIFITAHFMGAQIVFVSDKKMTERSPEGDGFELGEIMGTTQMHHSKLWFAGEARNWELATYELEEMEEGFDDAVKKHPVFQKVDLASDLLDKYTVQPLSDIRRSIEKKDNVNFTMSFDRLTSACNACHRETKHDFIVIQRPGFLQFSNQDFSVKAQ